MAIVSKAASSHTVVTTGWTTPTNAYSLTGDNAYATAAPGKNATVSGDFGFAFALSDFTGAASAAEVVIDQIVVTVEWKLSVTTNATLGVQLNNNGTALGTETTDTTSTADTQRTQTITTGITGADLINGLLKARIRDARGNTNTTHTGSLDFVKVDVTWHRAISQNFSDTVTLSDAIAKSPAKGLADTLTLSDTFTPTPAFVGLGTPYQGAAAETVFFNESDVSQFVLASGQTSSTAYAYCSNPDTVSIGFKIVVFTDNAGEPDALVVSSNELVLAAGAAGAWRAFTFPSATVLAAGTYWVGYHGLSGVGFSTGPRLWGTRNGAMRYSSDTYSDGTNSTWVPGGSDTVVYSVFIPPDAGGATNWTKNLADTVTLSDVLVKTLSKTLTDTTTLSDAASNRPAKALTDTVTLSDLIVKNLGLNRADTITLSDSFGRTWTIARTAADTITVSDATGKSVVIAKSDTLTLSDVMTPTSGGAANWTLNLADTISLADALTKAVSRTASDTVTLSDVVAKSLGLHKTDTITMSDTIAKAMAHALADTITLSDVATPTLTPAGTIHTLNLADTITLADAFARTLSNAGATTGTVRRARSIFLGRFGIY